MIHRIVKSFKVCACVCVCVNVNLLGCVYQTHSSITLKKEKRRGKEKDVGHKGEGAKERGGP